MMDRLDELIEGCNKWNKITSNTNISELSVLLAELKQRRESDLRPADKFLSNSIIKQFEHVVSEFEETQNEMYGTGWYCKVEDIAKNKPALISELCDLQMSCETMLAILGLDEQQRREARRKVIDKNEARGYYRKEEAL